MSYRSNTALFGHFRPITTGLPQYQLPCHSLSATILLLCCLKRSLIADHIFTPVQWTH